MGWEVHLGLIVAQLVVLVVCYKTWRAMRNYGQRVRRLTGEVSALYAGAREESAIASGLRAQLDRALLEMGRPPPPVSLSPPRFVCPDCNTVGFNPNEMEEGFCGKCCRFTVGITLRDKYQ